MLYLDYSRKHGEWIPNEYGGRENLEAIDFLRQFNEAVYSEYPDIVTHRRGVDGVAGVSRPTYLGGLGFGCKWDMGWMHDTLQYMAARPDPPQVPPRRAHLPHRSTRAARTTCCRSRHDEVVHGKGSLLAKMPGDDWQKFANLRLLYGYSGPSPARSCCSWAASSATWSEWAHEGTLDWGLHDAPMHSGVRS